MLPALASKGNATFVLLPQMSSPHTVDGIHLDAAGYAVWDAAVLKGASSACGQP
jgi:lysophospholipase L1-like esterase